MFQWWCWKGLTHGGLECAMTVRHAILFRMDCVIAIQLYSVIRSIFMHFLFVFPGDGFNGSTYISWDVELFCSAELKQSWYKGLRWRIVWRFDHIGSCQKDQKAGSCRCRWCNRRVWAVLILFALYFIACKWAVWVWGLFEERWRKKKIQQRISMNILLLNWFR